MPRTQNRPPAPKERPVALAVTGTPPLRPRSLASARVPASATFQGPRQTKVTDTGRSDMVALAVFVALIVLGLVAAARAFVVM